VVDVESGNAKLFVAPSGESTLIDTGNRAPDAAKRDADRIMAAAEDARLSQIDHLITTHWHGHFGGMVELANRIPIREFIDNGPNIQPVEAFDEFFARTYPAQSPSPSSGRSHRRHRAHEGRLLGKGAAKGGPLTRCKARR
jgi:glyoxylase-like metal-dependent hydrolase (beta-lactamase superfamily II)